EGLSGDAFALVDQPEEDVLGADVVVVEHPRFFLREDHDASGAIREPLEHLTRPSDRSPRRSPLPPGIRGATSSPRGTSGAEVWPQRPHNPEYTRGLPNAWNRDRVVRVPSSPRLLPPRGLVRNVPYAGRAQMGPRRIPPRGDAEAVAARETSGVRTDVPKN